MATFNKFNQFVEDLAEKVHNLGSDTMKILLTNTAPNVADTHVDTVLTPCVVEGTSNAAEIAAGNGYTKGGNQATAGTSAQTSGTYKLVLNDPTAWTAAGGTIGPFQYAVLYNETGGAAATRPVIGWWNYGSAVTLQIGESFTVDLDAANGVLTIA
jgi:hypothetical protein